MDGWWCKFKKSKKVHKGCLSPFINRQQKQKNTKPVIIPGLHILLGVVDKTLLFLQYP